MFIVLVQNSLFIKKMEQWLVVLVKIVQFSQPHFHLIKVVSVCTGRQLASIAFCHIVH